MERFDSMQDFPKREGSAPTLFELHNRRVQKMECVSNVRSSEEDLSKARQLKRTDCPRRYCWWWKGIQFKWDRTPTEGCDYPDAKKLGELPGYPDARCCREDPSSTIDLYEPREPCLRADGFSDDYFDVCAG